jgi:hypothetical protein
LFKTPNPVDGSNLRADGFPKSRRGRKPKALKEAEHRAMLMKLGSGVESYEPTPSPEISEQPLKKKRGRQPGSKNKPKAIPIIYQDLQDNILSVPKEASHSSNDFNIDLSGLADTYDADFNLSSMTPQID